MVCEVLLGLAYALFTRCFLSESDLVQLTDYPVKGCC